MPLPTMARSISDPARKLPFDLEPNIRTFSMLAWRRKTSVFARKSEKSCSFWRFFRQRFGFRRQRFGIKRQRFHCDKRCIWAEETMHLGWRSDAYWAIRGAFWFPGGNILRPRQATNATQAGNNCYIGRQQLLPLMATIATINGLCSYLSFSAI